jgi:hypothetical protein
MGHETLVNEQIEAGWKFVEDFNDYVPVSAAFWINPAETEWWDLYIASDQFDEQSITDGYREVWQRLGGKRTQWLDLSGIRLVSSSQPLAREIIRIRDHYSVQTPMRYPESMIGGIFIGGACIYPSLSVPNATPTP